MPAPLSAALILLDLDGTLLDSSFSTQTLFNPRQSASMLRGRLYDGVDETLAQLENHYRWGVVTNKSVMGAERDLRHFGLWERQSALVGGDSLEVCKPDPAPLLHACALVNASPHEALYVGDTYGDYEAARGAGMRFVFCRYGYSKTLPAHATPFAHIQHFSELLDVLGIRQP